MAARLIFADESPETGNDVLAIELDATRRVTPLVQTPFIERNGIISPDGRWLAYEANDSGRFEIYVRPYPEVNGSRWAVSTARGHAAGLDAKRPGADLCFPDWCADAGGGRARPIVVGHHADARSKGRVLHGSELVGSFVRRVDRRPTVPDDQGKRRRHRGIREHHRRPALGRGVETSCAGCEVGGGSSTTRCAIAVRAMPCRSRRRPTSVRAGDASIRFSTSTSWPQAELEDQVAARAQPRREQRRPDARPASDRRAPPNNASDGS